MSEGRMPDVKPRVKRALRAVGVLEQYAVEVEAEDGDDDAPSIIDAVAEVRRLIGLIEGVR